jgi:hypothetical protein
VPNSRKKRSKRSLNMKEDPAFLRLILKEKYSPNGFNEIDPWKPLVLDSQ